MRFNRDGSRPHPMHTLGNRRQCTWGGVAIIGRRKRAPRARRTDTRTHHWENQFGDSVSITRAR